MPPARSSARRPDGRPPFLLRLPQFLLGVAMCSVAVFTSLQAGLGVTAWDVLHSGVSQRSGLSFGTVTAVFGVAVLLLSAALGVRPGIGTFFNIVVIALALDALRASAWLDTLASADLWERGLALLGSVALLGTGAAVYIGAGFGSGPRDSLMVACHRHGLPVGASRLVIEVTVLLVGWALGGPVGVGTVVTAATAGPVTQLAFRLLRMDPQAGGRPR